MNDQHMQRVWGNAWLWGSKSLSGLAALCLMCFSNLADAQTTKPVAADAPNTKPTLAELLLQDIDPEILESSAVNLDGCAMPEIDVPRLAAAGIRQIQGQHLVLFTDLPESLAVDELPRVFDLAVSEWGKYLGVDEKAFADWQLVGYVMASDDKFRQASLLPEDLPPFLHGFQRGFELWVREQPSEYYRRHLLLHEGVHGFMSHHLQGMGPPWYREGMAELLATHRWNRGKLQVRVMPCARDEVPYWGRIKLVQDEFAAGRGKMIDEILKYRSEDYLSTEAYAWSWAVVAYLDGLPASSTLFRNLKNFVTESPLQFNRRMLEMFSPQLRELDEQWQLFVVNANYGYDFSAEAVAYGVGLPLERQQKVVVTANRGWQCSGIRVDRGAVYSVSAEGQFLLQERPELWPSEAGGVSIQYYRGAPLGMLLGSVRLDEAKPGIANLANPFHLGLSRNIRPDESGTLYLRINDHPAQVKDNSGELIVTVSLVQEPVGGN